MLSELGTLRNISDLVELDIFKESFIPLRTVFEKFMYFWLMFEAKKYRWTTTYKIIPKKNTLKNTRDNTFHLWKKEKAAGNIQFKDVLCIQCSKQDEIIVTYEFETLKDKTNTSNEINPIYHFVLEDYNPEDTHLTSIENISENTFPFIISYTDNKIKLGKFIYNNFFYINDIIGNLVINKLVYNTNADRIKVYYNFMSKYVHPSKASIEIWLQFNESSYSNYPKINFVIYRELILLYIGRLMYLYFKTYVNYYKDDDNKNECEKYENLIEGNIK